ncbi:MAG: c-type cytochrome [Gammaproteobacteria bacterium]|nr:c-type cytochrome [Gammaproteobacteria bacterium]MDH5653389.1 c-type cytochrome [Gammaproteobacteria bacterium]
MRWIYPVFMGGMILCVTACGGGAGGGGAPASSAAEVGKLIFTDRRLSANGNQSCADCHDPAVGFADPDVTQNAPVSEGSPSGGFGNRNAPTSAYAGFTPAFGQVDVGGTLFYAGGQFLDGRRDSLEQQAKDPFLNPLEMANSNVLAVVEKVRTAAYADRFMAVYGANVFADANTAFNNIAAAIAAFERSAEMNKFNSKFDCYLQNATAYPLSANEANGLTVFNGKGKCSGCHSTTPDPVSGKVLLTDHRYFNIGVPKNPNNPANVANPSFIDKGLGARKGASENGKFKTPTLRNVALTAPYMHNGVFATLDEVMTFYNIDEKVTAVPAPEVSANITADVDFLGLTQQEMDDVTAFMRTLTDGSGTGICF